ncbi:GAF and ANTAR domain-containing protein [Pseudarthrobacter sulfonivorans]|uniref:GAF and ANTAR domain-containing protein n=1 Tax=Pseudarthrobacter sulfonivorans TaxID=121292 RepID=UPI00285D8F92|nr:GAF and ANTAR domain-containing protein [Pseudarthrobacter sulfonivorans]MDR6415720.1 GAF domain-containing protein [Pseudarthrobacter sulfonivorans]
MAFRTGNTKDAADQKAAVTAGLAEQLSDLARDLQEEDDTDALLADIVHAALDLIPHVAAASISLVMGRRTVLSQAASGEVPRLVDALQSATGQGPCIDAAYEERIVRVPDMGHEERWPDFAAAAYDAGARSMLSFQLFVKGDNLGALNLYGDDANVFDEESEQVGLLVASHAAVAFSDAQEISQLNQALDTRDVIGQAKGILMERFKITAQQAFQVLIRASSETNTKLRDVAEHLTGSGEIPTRNRTGA